MRKNRCALLVLMTVIWLTAIAFGYQENLQTEASVKDSDSQIVINQVGYELDGPKSAFLINRTELESNIVKLVNLENRKTVFTTQLGQPKQDRSTKELIQNIDFSLFNQAGNYYLKFGNLQSYPFKIGKKIHQDSLTKLLRSYYLQRCGVAVQDRLTGINHPACHLRDGVIAHKDSFYQNGSYLAAQGGWHDAGDYGKYVASTAVTIGQLLSLYEQYPKFFRELELAIPESNNNIPDLLDEVKVGLDWMLRMQRPDGAVYRKLSGKTWPAIVPPHKDKQPRFIYGISTSETAKFAAATAMAARVYSPYYSKFAQTCLQASEKAWSFLQTELAMKVDWVEGDDSGSGGYIYESKWEDSLKIDRSNRLWAAAELFITTADKTKEKYLAENIPSFSYTLFEWTDPSSLGMRDYLLQQHTQTSNMLKSQIEEKLLKRADLLLKQVTENGYRIANQDFFWGSNKRTAEDGITLFYAYRLTGSTMYLQAAIDQLDYLLGRNHFNKSFVTGVGHNPVQHIDHILIRADKISIPGLLVGGPNEQAEDGIAPKNQGPLSYLDNELSYATNEYAIDYNASLIGLIGLLMSSKS